MSVPHRIQSLFGSQKPEGVYRCGHCEKRFELNRQQCTECGSFLIERSRYDDLLAID